MTGHNAHQRPRDRSGCPARYPQLQQMCKGGVWQAVLFVYRKSTFCLITREVFFAILLPVSASRNPPNLQIEIMVFLVLLLD